MLHINNSISARRKDALRDYVFPIISSSRLFEHCASLNADILFNNCSIVSTSPDDQSHPFSTGFGVHSPESFGWLVNTIITFLRSETQPIAIVDDFVGSPSDPIFIKEIPDRFWIYGNRILWPMTKDLASAEACTEILGWASGGPEVIFLCSPVDFSDMPANQRRFALSESQADRLRNSLRHIIVDVFDSEGYVVLSIPGRIGIGTSWSEA